MIRLFFVLLIGKIIIFFSRLFNFGNGGTWPGEIALFLYPDILREFIRKVDGEVVLVTGTNGKTTTAKMIKNITVSLSKSRGQNITIVHNESGANLINGLISAFIQKSSFIHNKYDYAVLEVDEAAIRPVLEQIKGLKTKFILVFLNLFRDQLDRYGEVDAIADKWVRAIVNLPKTSILILNADDPQVAFLGKNDLFDTVYFGLNSNIKSYSHLEDAIDSIYCPLCKAKLFYKKIFFSHLGLWFCEKCGNERPITQTNNYISSLLGTYNLYNVQAAAAVGKLLGASQSDIKLTLKEFIPVFGRQEELYVGQKKIKIFLAKNPAGFNAILYTVLEMKPKNILLVLNDRIPDGRDVSWIWDVDFEMIGKNVQIITSGDRAFDMALRLKYALKDNKNETKIIIEKNLERAVQRGLDMTEEKDTLYILPTYSAMLEVRKIVSGKEIL